MTSNTVNSNKFYYISWTINSVGKINRNSLNSWIIIHEYWIFVLWTIKIDKEEIILLNIFNVSMYCLADVHVFVCYLNYFAVTKKVAICTYITILLSFFINHSSRHFIISLSNLLYLQSCFHFSYWY